jgi:DNA-binding NtrC family response regulator
MTRSDAVTADEARLALKPAVKEADAWSFAGNDFREAKESFEREFLARKLAETEWNVTRTAELIGMERSHLHRKIKAYGLEKGKAAG